MVIIQNDPSQYRNCDCSVPDSEILRNYSKGYSKSSPLRTNHHLFLHVLGGVLIDLLAGEDHFGPISKNSIRHRLLAYSGFTTSVKGATQLYLWFPCSSGLHWLYLSLLLFQDEHWLYTYHLQPVQIFLVHLFRVDFGDWSRTEELCFVPTREIDDADHQ